MVVFRVSAGAQVAAIPQPSPSESRPVQRAAYILAHSVSHLVALYKFTCNIIHFTINTTMHLLRNLRNYFYKYS